MKGRTSVIKKRGVGYLGPEGTFSWSAAKNLFPQENLKPFPSIKEVFSAVADNEVNVGFVPIENSISGLVSETMYSFLDFPAYSLGSFMAPIDHCLASFGKSLKEIEVVKTHLQPLVQCRKWLDKNLPHALKEVTLSTVTAAQEDSSKHTAFILSEESAKNFGLNILAKDIANDEENFTKFLIISRRLDKEVILKSPANWRTDKSLLLVSVYDRVGILKDILTVLADYGMNLSGLHSIPSYSRPWDYSFFFEVEKPLFSKEFEGALKDLKEYCFSIRIIGSA